MQTRPMRALDGGYQPAGITVWSYYSVVGRRLRDKARACIGQLLRRCKGALAYGNAAWRTEADTLDGG